MSIRPVGHDHAVVDANGQLVTARRDHAEVVDVWRDEAAIGSDLLSVQPHSRFPVRTLERQHKPAVGLVLSDLNVALIPRRAEVMARRLR